MSGDKDALDCNKCVKWIRKYNVSYMMRTAHREFMNLCIENFDILWSDEDVLYGVM